EALKHDSELLAIIRNQNGCFTILNDNNGCCFINENVEAAERRPKLAYFPNRNSPDCHPSVHATPFKQILTSKHFRLDGTILVTQWPCQMFLRVTLITCWRGIQFGKLHSMGFSSTSLFSNTARGHSFLILSKPLTWLVSTSKKAID
ncbi:hypothetical protein PFISCL1PPCAC_26816, partial [Pristionchus fissidentatus]